MSKTKGGGSTRNGRDSNAQRLGVKVYDGGVVTAGSIIGSVIRSIGRRTAAVTIGRRRENRGRRAIGQDRRHRRTVFERVFKKVGEVLALLNTRQFAAFEFRSRAKFAKEIL